MDESIKGQQPVQNIEDRNNQFFPFHIHKKIAIVMLVGLFFFVFGVGAYYIGKQSTNNNQAPYPSPSSVIIQSTTTPSNIPSVPEDTECLKNTDCSKLDCIQAPCPSIQCINNKCVTVQPSTTQSNNKCNSNVDCPIIGGAGAACQDQNNCNLPVVRAQCINGYCDDYLNWSTKTICWPGPEENHKNIEVFKKLGDGTFIYLNSQTGEMFRGTENNCE